MAESIEENKIKDIVEKLKNEGVIAGRKEADQIINDAKKKADDIVSSAHKEHDKIIENAKNENDKILRSAQANIRMAISQSINQFKEAIEKNVLENTIIERLKNEINSEDTISNVITTIVEAYSKNNFDTNELSIILDENTGNQIKDTLLESIKERISNTEGLKIEDEKIPAGVILKNNKENLSIEVTIDTLKKVLISFIRPEFRKIFFEKEEKPNDE